jgi:hypothetical protein
MTKRSRRFTDFAESKTWATSGSSTTATAVLPIREAKGFGRLFWKSIRTLIAARHDRL